MEVYAPRAAAVGTGTAANERMRYGRQEGSDLGLQLGLVELRVGIDVSRPARGATNGRSRRASTTACRSRSAAC